VTDVERWGLEFRDFVLESRLCTAHKMLMIAIMSFMRADDPQSHPNLTKLQRRSSLSRTRVVDLLSVLQAYDWVQIGKASFLPQPGPKPNLYRLPRRDLVPQVPPHCQKVRDRSKNLRRGPKKEDS
jgi:DNA-binding IclR family transcriptional regulator